MVLEQALLNTNNFTQYIPRELFGVLDSQYLIVPKTNILYIVSLQGLNAALFYENPDPRTYVSLVPTSAVTGEGMGNLLAMIVQACEGPLHKRLVFSQQLLATVLEVRK